MASAAAPPWRVLLLAAIAWAEFEVSILVTREVRGAAFPITSKYTGETCPNATIDRAAALSDANASCACVAGAARRRAVMGPSDTTVTNQVTLDAGSYFSGSGNLYTAFAGNASAELFANVSYSAFGLTYRDFSVGVSNGSSPYGLRDYLVHLRSLWPDQDNLPRATVSNIDVTDEALLSPYLQPYSIINLPDNREMAVFSLTDPTHLSTLVPEYASRLISYLTSLTVQIEAGLKPHFSHSSLSISPCIPATPPPILRVGAPARQQRQPSPRDRVHGQRDAGD